MKFFNTRREISYLPCGHGISPIRHKHTEIHSLKNYVVNFHTQMNYNQSELQQVWISCNTSYLSASVDDVHIVPRFLCSSSDPTDDLNLTQVDPIYNLARLMKSSTSGLDLTVIQRQNLLRLNNWRVFLANK